MTIAVTSELNAVNSILASIGNAPLTTLTGTLSIDATMAQNALHAEVRRICSYGFAFNTEHEYPITADGSGNLNLSATMLHADLDTRYHAGKDSVQRGLFLYDRKNHTFVWDAGTYKCTVKLLVQFDDMPEAARMYAALSAGQKFQSNAVGDQLLYRFDEKEVQEAWLTLLEEESDAADANIFEGGQAYRPLHAVRRANY